MPQGWLPPVGTDVVVPTEWVLPCCRHQGIVVNIPELRLYYFRPAPGDPKTTLVTTYPVGLGRDDRRTPRGTFTVRARQANPAWYIPESIRREHIAERGDARHSIPGGAPDNPLGRYRLQLTRRLYGIHGTDNPWGIGMQGTHGCIRLYPEDIEQFFNMIPVGTEVRVVNQPFLFGWGNGQLYLQPMDVLEDDTRDWSKAQRKLLSKSLTAALQQQLKAEHQQIDWDLVAQLTHDPRGIPVPVSAANASLDQVLAAAPRVQNVVPRGSTWDGKSDLPMDEASFKQMFSEIEPGSTGPAAAAAPSPAGATPAPAAATRAPAGAAASKTPPPVPKDGGG